MEFFTNMFAVLAALGTVTGEAGEVSDSFSPVAIFWRADVAVKSVLIILVLMSLRSWALIFERWLTFRDLSRKGHRFERHLWKSGDISEFDKKEASKGSLHPHSLLFRAAMNEWKGKKAVQGARFSRILAAASERLIAPMSRGLGTLATIGATAPFIGLFGTVWGIMNSFQSIALAGETSLTVVAPGIAEALFATALGLFAAIPAVIFYNQLSQMLRRYTDMLHNFADQLWVLLTRAA